MQRKTMARKVQRNVDSDNQRIISAHDLRIKSGRSSKHYICMSNRICTRCELHKVGDEFQFLPTRNFL